MRVSHADARPQPMEIPVTFITYIEIKTLSNSSAGRKGKKKNGFRLG